MMNETLIPVLGVITDVRIDTPDIKTFRVLTPDGKKPFDHRPGQCAMRVNWEYMQESQQR